MNTLNPKNAVKSVAAEQIKRACQNYWGPPAPLLPGPSLCYGTAHSGVTTSKPNLSLVHNLGDFSHFKLLCVAVAQSANPSIRDSDMTGDT